MFVVKCNRKEISNGRHPNIHDAIRRGLVYKENSDRMIVIVEKRKGQERIRKIF
jgi:hypothetical protein